jgi:hypothetical protein
MCGMKTCILCRHVSALHEPNVMTLGYVCEIERTHNKAFNNFAQQRAC